MLRVPTIVKACPNLVSLCIYDTPDVDVSSLSLRTWPALTTLSLTYSHTGITYDQIIEIWKRFPSLKNLALHPCSDIESALVVLQYAPRVSKIDFLMYDEGIQFTYSDEEQPSRGIGITTLTISTEKGKICKNTTSIVKQYHNTVEKIEWIMDTSYDTDTIGNLHYPRLMDLYLNMSGSQIPCNAPLLEELDMSLKTIKANPVVLSTIPPNLKKLALHLNRGLDSVTMLSISFYLDRLARQHQLTQLVINLDSDDNADSLLHFHQSS